MTKGDIDGVLVFGRPFKPVAMGFALAMVILVFINVTDTGRLGANWLGDVVAILAGIALVFLIGGWWGRWQRWVEVGLLFTFGTYAIRGFFILFAEGISQSIWFSFVFAFIAGGAYMLEVNDHTVSR